MHRTYAVTWQEREAARRSGKLELRLEALSLEGTKNGADTIALVVPYSDVIGLRMASGAERLDGRPTLVLDRWGDGSLRVASVAAPGIVSEVAEELASLKLRDRSAHGQVAVVVPIANGALEKVQALLEQGPPFEPERLGVGRHQVFLTDREVIFTFESGRGFDLEQLMGDPTAWASAAAWQEAVSDVPRIARPLYSWEAPAADESIFYGATPGPGDSDGGDVYSPE